MAIISEIIRIEKDNTLSFGNYEVIDKQKIDDFEFDGNNYQVRTHKEVTRITKNTTLLLETVPGTAIHNFKSDENATAFSAEGIGNTQFTLELEGETNYTVYVDDVNLGTFKTSVVGKISFSAELNRQEQSVKIEKHQ